MSTRNLVAENNARRDHFVDLMAAGTMSATKAWIQAGYSPTGANGAASRALAKPAIQKLIADRKRELAEVSGRGAEAVIAELWRLARHADSDAAQVSALRTLADVHGLLGGQQAELPAGLDRLLVALAERAATPPPSPVTIEARVTETR